MPHRYMELPNINGSSPSCSRVQQISPLLIIHGSHTNIPPALHNEAQHRRVDTLQYFNELMSNSESQKPTQQFKIQSSISNNNAHEN